jgi:hypothetical protein
MPKIKKISILKPCEMLWQDMSPNMQGRYCNNCTKTVIDFTGMTNNEIINHLSIHHNLCGRFYQYQLNMLNNILENKAQPGFPWRALAAVASLIGLLTPAKAATVSLVKTEQMPSVFNKDTIKPKGDSSYITLKGRVVAKDTKLPVINALLMTDSSDISTNTDANGEFIFKVPANTLFLWVYCLGYQTDVIRIDQTNNKPISIVLGSPLPPIVIGEIRTIKRPDYIWWHKNKMLIYIDKASGYLSVMSVLNYQYDRLYPRLKFLMF